MVLDVVKGMSNYMKKLSKKRQQAISILIIFVISVLVFWDTCGLPMIGDALLHMDDITVYPSVKDFLRPLYTLDGIKGNTNNPVINFHRPIFDEYIVTALKIVFNNNTMQIRSISLLVFGGINVCAFIIGYIISDGKLFNGIICSIMTMFSYAYLFPLLDWGLSFSLWLTLNACLALISLCMYEKKQKNWYLAFSIVFTFIATFIKESAMVLSVALCFYFLSVTLVKYRKINIKLVFYCIAQFIIFISYFITRIIKLGTFFDVGVVGGGTANNSISIRNIGKKLYDYFMYSFNIPTKSFFDYMMRHLSDINLGVGVVLVITVILILKICVIQFINKPLDYVKMPIGFILFIIFMLPSVTVERNGLYYNDLAMIGILVIIASIDFSGYRITGVCFCVAYILAYILNVQAMYLSHNHYLIKGECQLREIRDELLKYDYTGKKVVQMSAFEANSEMHWYVNNVKTGTFFKYNVSDNVEVQNIDNTFNKIDLEHEIYIDYWDSQSNYYNPLVLVMNQDTAANYSILRINPIDSLTNFNLQIEYQGNIYEKWIDTQYYLQNQNQEYLYFVLPQGSQITFDNSMIEEVNFVGA